MSGGLTTKPGSVPASAFRISDPFRPGSHAYAERHAIRSHEMMPGLIRVDIGGPPRRRETSRWAFRPYGIEGRHHSRATPGGSSGGPEDHRMVSRIAFGDRRACRPMLTNLKTGLHPPHPLPDATHLDRCRFILMFHETLPAEEGPMERRAAAVN